MQKLDHVSTAEAAEIFGRPIATVNRWARDGRLTPVMKLPGRTGANVFARREVEALASLMRQSRSAAS